MSPEILESEFNMFPRPENSSREQIPSIIEKQALIDRYPDLLKQLSPQRLQFGEKGNVDGIDFEVVFSAGKQQPVHILRLKFPENISFDVVVRPTHGYFEELYKGYDVVKKHYPHILASKSSDLLLQQKTLLLDRIEGYEHKFNGKEFEQYVADPENFEKLCTEMFNIVDDIHTEPLMLQDIGATSGHNVIFNKHTKRFQLFDVDTLSPSNWTFERKFMYFVNHNQPMDDIEIRFLMRMVQLYIEKYKDAQLSYEGEEKMRGDYIELTGETEGFDDVIYQGDPRYEKCYTALHWRGTQGQQDLPPVALIKRKGKDVFSIGNNLIETIMQNNFTGTKDIVSNLRGRLVEETFIESAK